MVAKTKTTRTCAARNKRLQQACVEKNQKQQEVLPAHLWTTGPESFCSTDLLLNSLFFRDSLDLSGRELTHTRGLAQTFVAVMTLNLSKNSISMIGALPIGLRVLDLSLIHI